MPGSATRLSELLALFLRLGATAFGGPAAHVALMREEVVRRRRWLTETEYLDLVSAANMIPGPNSTEVALHVGWKRRGLPGLLVSGLSFVLPSALLTGALGWAYVRFGNVPEVGRILYGVKPVVLAVVVQAIVGLAAAAAPTWPRRALGVAAVLASGLGVHELAVLFGSGALVLFLRGFARRTAARGAFLSLLPFAGASAVSAVTLPGLFFVFLKTGAVLFGSGYVLLAFLRADLVERLHWLTESQLVDAIAVGQLTPAPVSTSATFIGWLLGGPAGAAAATAGMFLPAFVFVALSAPLVPRLRASKPAAAFLDGVNVASLALMAVVTARLARAAVVDVPTALVGIAAAAILVAFRPNPTWLLLAGAAAGAFFPGARIAR